MVRRKGQITKWRAERDFPFGVEIEIPPLGLGACLDDLHRWCCRRVGPDGYLASGRVAGLRSFLAFRFKTDGAAVEFRRLLDAKGIAVPPFARRTFT